MQNKQRTIKQLIALSMCGIATQCENSGINYSLIKEWFEDLNISPICKRDHKDRVYFTYTEEQLEQIEKKLYFPPIVYIDMRLVENEIKTKNARKELQ